MTDSRPWITETFLKPVVIDEIKLIGTVDRCLSELHYILEHPDDVDVCTLQTLKHHIEDMGLFVKWAEGKMTNIKALPALASQRRDGL